MTYSYYYCKPMLYKYQFDSDQILEDLDSIVAEAERQRTEIAKKVLPHPHGHYDRQSFSLDKKLPSLRCAPQTHRHSLRHRIPIPCHLHPRCHWITKPSATLPTSWPTNGAATPSPLALAATDQ